uniref:Lipid-binding serum glycoprotein N-terminal domain-containing protein n=1 Tax=Ciona intestinalis TaxID=7719 RepID=H2XPV6_CIOIN
MTVYFAVRCILLIFLVTKLSEYYRIQKNSTGPLLPEWNETLDLLPSLNVKVTEKGLNFLKDAGLMLATKQVRGIKLPDVSDKSKIAIIGNVKYTLSEIRINSFTLARSKIITEAPNTVRLVLQNAFVQLSGNWRYKIRFISGHGSFDAKANGISVNLAISIGMNDFGQPTV